MQVSAAGPQVQNRIAHKLTGSVIRGLAAAVRLEHRVGESSRVAQTGFIEAPADRVNRFVLQEQDALLAGQQASLHEFFLSLQAVCVRDPA